jgi:uncharacterized protein YbjQ (UPF0145 family)
MDTLFCPNCKSEVKPGFFAAVGLSKPNTNTLINVFGSGAADGYCTKCEDAFIRRAASNYLNQLEAQKKIISETIEILPIISIQNPLNWDYIALGLVTAQSVLGTGLISEVSSSFTDLFGTQSKSYNKKLIEGENFCKNILRKKALDLGGNAIIGTDVDYSEAGSLKGMLMVCMAGTAIQLNNTEVTGVDQEKLKKLTESNQWMMKYKDIYFSQ